MDLEVGMYARIINTLEEYVEIIRIKENYELDNFIIDENGGQYCTDEILKASHNVIELIKKKDLILATDGKIYEVAKIYEDYVFTTTKTKDGVVKTLVDYQIDRILTKEQFESMSYKVKE